jgi:hypothetical protein
MSLLVSVNAGANCAQASNVVWVSASNNLRIVRGSIEHAVQRIRSAELGMLSRRYFYIEFVRSSIRNTILNISKA